MSKENKKKALEHAQKSAQYMPDADTATAFELASAFGTYEVQKTADTDNDFPCIAQGKSKKK